MIVQNTSTGLYIPFANPIEVFSVGARGAIDFTGSNQAVCRQLTVESMGILQSEKAAPTRMVIGVHSEGHVFFLPGHRVDFQRVGAGVFAVQARFTAVFNPQGPPPKIEFISEKKVGAWVRQMQQRRKPGQEKRQYERTAYNEPIRLSGAPAGHPVFALNLSEGGIALITTFPVSAEVVRVLRLPQPDGTTVRRKARIVRCMPIIPRFYDVGGQFIAD
jgi:PilZ domain